MRYKDKKIAVLGFGESGEAAAKLLAREGAMVTILDRAELKKLRSKIEKLHPLGVELIAGASADDDSAHYDMGVISPGVDPSTPLVQNFLRKRIALIGELELAFEMCQCPVVAITGTNGKTTTTEVVASMFNACGMRTLASGNIGPAFAATVQKSRELDVMTLEVSSFQLERIRTFRPHVSVWLNFAPDHLDRYASIEEYRTAKLRIFENQTDDDFAVVNFREKLPPIPARLITFSACVPGGDFAFHEGAIFHHGKQVLRMSDTKMRGLHNAENLMAALGVGLAYDLSFERMTPPLCDYSPAPHRCELVAVADGVEYINDSKATNLDALEKALDSQDRPVILIAGGKDKGFGFEPLARLVGKKVRIAILIGEMAARIEASWRESARCIIAGSLAEAVELARRNATSGETVLFSPGTSSFDMFKNYADRGNQFRALVEPPRKA